ncbi:MAG TPA: hypothetical protein VHC43_07910 [Mycobacteriales bacterium]|nr:hypothetical protein [Mycobacteriales bacterium]
MDAYVLGTHESDLPTHLLQDGAEGDRVRAIARLNGVDHNAFYAIEAPDAESAELHLEKIKGLGTNVNWWLIHCVAEDCLGLMEIKPFSILNPSKMPPYDFYLILTVEQEHVRDEVATARQLLGEDGVAAATDGRGRFLIELGSNDQSALDAAVATFGVATHAVSGDGFIRG